MYFFVWNIPVSANDWFNSDWKYRRKLTFNNLTQSENLTDFPVLIVLNTNRIDTSQVQNLGQDLRFTDTSGTILKHEIEIWDETGSSYVWVKVPQIDSVSDSSFIWMYYGNTAATDGQDNTAVWSNGYLAVWHLGEDPSGGNPIKDSGPNAKDGTPMGGMNATNVVTGRVGNALEFDGSTDHIRVSSDSTDVLAIAGDSITLELWMKRNGDTPGNIWMAAAGRQLGTGSSDSYITALKFDDPSLVAFNTTAGGNASSPTGAVPDSTWRYLVGVQDVTNVTIYSEGIQVGQIASGGAIQTDSNDVTFGGQENSSDSTIDTWYQGTLDEIRISDVSRSKDWIAAQYASMIDSFVTYSAPEAGGTIVLHPTSDGVPIQFGTYPFDSDFFDMVNDQTGNTGTGPPEANDGANYVWGSIGQRVMLQLDDGTVPEGATITEISIHAQTNRAGGLANISLSYQRKAGATTPDASPIDGADYDLGNSCCTEIIETWSNLNWTTDDLDNLEIGAVQNSGDGDSRITQLYVIVSYVSSMISLAVSNSTFGYGVTPLNQWLTADSSFVINDGSVAEDFMAQISIFTDGSNNWDISNTTNGADSIRAQWSTTSNTGPWTDISAYNNDFTIATNVAVSDTVTYYFRIQTPTSTTSFNQYSSTLTVTAQEY